MAIGFFQAIPLTKKKTPKNPIQQEKQTNKQTPPNTKELVLLLLHCLPGQGQSPAHTSCKNSNSTPCVVWRQAPCELFRHRQRLGHSQDKLLGSLPTTNPDTRRAWWGWARAFFQEDDPLTSNFITTILSRQITRLPFSGRGGPQVQQALPCTCSDQTHRAPVCRKRDGGALPQEGFALSACCPRASPRTACQLGEFSWHTTSNGVLNMPALALGAFL